MSSGCMASSFASSSLSTTSASSRRQDELSYNVLYYKRKNKTHKARGVTKIDGVLTMTIPMSTTTQPTRTAAAAAAVVTLRNEADMEIIFQGIQNEVSRRGALEVDETIQVGAYEVEIVSTVDASHNDKSVLNSTTSTTRNETTSTEMTTMTMSMMKPKQTHPKTVQVARNLGHINRVSASSALSLSSSASNTAGGKRTLLIRKPPAQPVKRVRPCDSSTSGQDTSTTTATASSVEKENRGGAGTVNLPSTNLNNKHNYKPFPTFKRPFLVQKNAVSRCNNSSSSIPEDGLLHKNSHQLMNTNSKICNSNDTNNNNNTNVQLLPGRTLVLDVPHSIKSVLRPHQIDGVKFLWNCLTTTEGSATGKKPQFYTENSERRFPPIDSDSHESETRNSGYHYSSSSSLTSTTATARGCILCDGT
jgi:hypothetical protein